MNGLSVATCTYRSRSPECTPPVSTIFELTGKSSSAENQCPRWQATVFQNGFKFIDTLGIFGTILALKYSGSTPNTARFYVN